MQGYIAYRRIKGLSSPYRLFSSKYYGISLDRGGEALEHYVKFLFLWKDAYPGLPDVDDAKKRLAGLK